ncbi:MAG: hypothetical protein IKX78_00625, partial [Clostridia bacterium]|nr:hypothetical protein [Clostridia bacterium]
PVPLAGYLHIPGMLTLALSVAEYSEMEIHLICALSGPFDNLFPVCISPPQTLCTGIIAVISASTV